MQHKQMGFGCSNFCKEAAKAHKLPGHRELNPISASVEQGFDGIHKWEVRFYFLLDVSSYLRIEGFSRENNKMNADT